MRKKDEIFVPEQEPELVKIKNRGNGLLIRGLGLLVIAVVIVAIGYFYVWPMFYPSELTAEQQAQKMQEETMAVVAKVTRHMILPTDEVPQMAEIKDATLAVKEQPFYSGSQNGDKVLIYLKAGKAIIFSPARDIIVNVGIVSMNENATN